MNRLARWMISLYPAKWRARYGHEMDALLTDSGADARALIDLFAGGIRMQFSTWPFPGLALVLGLIGILLGAGASFLITPQYVSSALLTLSSGTEDKQPTASTMDLNSRANELTVALMARGSLAQIIADPRLELYPEELKVTSFEDVIEQMRRDISIQLASSPAASSISRSVLRISFLYSDRAKARLTLQAIIARLVDENLKRTQFPVLFSVIDVPNLPGAPVFPNMGMIVFLGFVVGVLTAIVWRKARGSGFVARRFAISVIAFGIAGSLLAGLAGQAGFLGRRFVSTGTVQIQSGTPDQRQALVKAVSDQQSLVMQQHLRIVQSLAPPGSSEGLLLRISFEDGDRFKAQKTVGRVIASFAKEIDRLHMDRVVPARLLQPSTLTVLDPPSMPFMPVKPKRLTVAGLGGTLGVLIAAVIALIRRRWIPESRISEAANG